MAFMTWYIQYKHLDWFLWVQWFLDWSIIHSNTLHTCYSQQLHLSVSLQARKTNNQIHTNPTLSAVIAPWTTINNIFLLKLHYSKHRQSAVMWLFVLHWDLKDVLLRVRCVISQPRPHVSDQLSCCSAAPQSAKEPLPPSCRQHNGSGVCGFGWRQSSPLNDLLLPWAPGSW